MPAPQPGPGRLSVFLSHRYHSPAENAYFWLLLSSVEDVSFRVDEGVSFTSPVRLERMIREADGFVGIYPLAGRPREVYTRSALRHAARYFRLELSMAVRARKPAIVFHDQRLVPALKWPSDVRLIAYDAQELGTEDHSSLPMRVANAYREFVADARAAASPGDPGRTYQKRQVGLVISPSNERVMAELCDLLHEYGWEPVRLPWPPRLHLDSITTLRQCDWAVVDLDDPSSRVMAAFTHGQFIPTLPIASASAAYGSTAGVPDEETLYGDEGTGHRKAIIRWAEPANLRQSFEDHLGVIDEQSRYVGGWKQAAEYFRSATKRSERVFLSYAAEDSDQGAAFSRLLNERFQHVFDYRSSQAIPAGEPWMEHLLSGLARSAVGVLLMSEAYRSSKYCLLEARELYRAAVEGRARLVPVRLEATSDLPDFLEGVQYRALYKQSAQEIVDELVSELARMRQGDSVTRGSDLTL
ncbi:toll/interleukin-1 receptor domain-containing protein [Streptomyces sp. NBC_01353]|uniref:toll/interleukin-1 receptor domain-containing protein n=1 Tax=Streptomyces sp. NBC_01353 TaxID=2903835 RepID=UPI002E3642A0|nr:toll/interleukin-1 receptor domain-containing protein [Streptomyces sp. NBC_01353]